MIKRALILMSILGSAACGSSPSSSTQAASTPAVANNPATAADRKYLLERVDDAAVVQLYADGFSELPLKEKTLVWHLYQAALAGRDIFQSLFHRTQLAVPAIYARADFPHIERRHDARYVGWVSHHRNRLYRGRQLREAVAYHRG